jgi:hypothetical protein
MELLKKCDGVAQKRTSKNKAFVFYLGNEVIKGPYPKNSKRLKRIEMITKLGYHPPCLLLPKRIDVIDGYDYLIYDNLATFAKFGQVYKETFSSFEYRLLEESDLNPMQVSDMNDGNIPDLLLTWLVLHIYGTGDLNPRNTLWSATHQRFYIVDVEDQRNEKDVKGELFWFNRDPSNKKEYLDLLLPHFEQIIVLLEKLDLNSYENKKRLVIEKLRAMVPKTTNIGKMCWKGMKFPSAALTYSGHPYDVMISALQKYVRRSEVDLAVQVAAELYRMGELDPAPRSNLFNRVMVIAVEDVGVADLDICLHVIELLLKKENRTLDNLISCVVNLADPDTFKTRVMSHLRHTYANPEKAKRHGLKLPPIVEDNLTEFEKCVKDGNREMFFYYNNYLSQTKDQKVDATYKPYTKNRTTNPQVCLWVVLSKYLAIDIYLPLANGFWSASESSPYIMVAMCCLIYKNKTNKIVLVSEYEKKIDLEYKIPFIHDYAIDKHTRLGRKKGMTRKEFVEEGALVYPEAEEYIDQMLVAIYKEC